MAKCSNCGYDSHCGNKLSKDLSVARSFRTHADSTANQKVEVCKNCRCDDCEE